MLLLNCTMNLNVLLMQFFTLPLHDSGTVFFFFHVPPVVLFNRYLTLTVIYATVFIKMQDRFPSVE